MFADQASDNLAFIFKRRFGRDTVLEHSKFSLLLGNSHLFLVYGETLILKGNYDDELCFAMNGLLEKSMQVISSYVW
jgi:hypothetical protein